LEVEGYMDKHEYYAEDFDESEIFVSDPDWNDHMMEVSTTINTPFELRMVYSLEKGEVVSHSLELPEEIKPDYHY
jgi:hypothetical protein